MNPIFFAFIAGLMIGVAGGMFIAATVLRKMDEVIRDTPPRMYDKAVSDKLDLDEHEFKLADASEEELKLELEKVKATMAKRLKNVS